MPRTLAGLLRSATAAPASPSGDRPLHQRFRAVERPVAHGCMLRPAVLAAEPRAAWRDRLRPAMTTRPATGCLSGTTSGNGHLALRDHYASTRPQLIARLPPPQRTPSTARFMRSSASALNASRPHPGRDEPAINALAQPYDCYLDGEVTDLTLDTPDSLELPLP